jgi:hypothetical protein
MKTWKSCAQIIVAHACAIAVSAASGASAASAVPDPCKLVTATEVEQVAGKLKGAPTPGDVAAGDVSCEYAPAKGPSWISVRLHDGDLAAWRKRNGGPNPVPVPELGRDAFANLDSEGSTDLFAKKGAFILRVSLPKGPGALDMAKAIAKAAMPRL